MVTTDYTWGHAWIIHCYAQLLDSNLAQKHDFHVFQGERIRPVVFLCFLGGAFFENVFSPKVAPTHPQNGFAWRPKS